VDALSQQLDLNDRTISAYYKKLKHHIPKGRKYFINNMLQLSEYYGVLLHIAFNDRESAVILEENGKHGEDKIRARYLDTLLYMLLMIKTDPLDKNNVIIEIVKGYHDRARKHSESIDKNREIISDLQLAKTTAVFQSVIPIMYKKYGYQKGMESYIILWEYIGARLRNKTRFTPYFENFYFHVKRDEGEALVKLYVDLIMSEFISKYYVTYQDKFLREVDDVSTKIINNYSNAFVISPLLTWYTFRHILRHTENYNDEEFLMIYLKKYVFIPLPFLVYKMVYPYLCPMYGFFIEKFMVENIFLSYWLKNLYSTTTTKNIMSRKKMTQQLSTGFHVAFSFARYALVFLLFFIVLLFFLY